MTPSPEPFKYPPSTPLLYVVAYDSTDDLSEPYEPLIFGGSDFSQATYPHGLSLEMARALSAVRYCLHLPMALADFLDLPAGVLRFTADLPLGHRIAVLPGALLAEFMSRADNAPLALVCCSDALVAVAEGVARARQALLPVLSFSSIDHARLPQDWASMAEALELEAMLPPLGVDGFCDEQLGPSLATRRLARQMHSDITVQPAEAGGDFRQWVGRNWALRSAVNAVASVEDMEATPSSPSALLAERTEEARRTSKLSVLVLGGLGASRRHTRSRAPGDPRRSPPLAVPPPDGEEVTDVRESDAPLERRALDLMVTHRAVAHDGVGLLLPDLPDAAFQALWQLEDHWRARNGARARGANRLLTKLNEAAGPSLSDDVVAAAARSERLKIYSSFPFGLLSPSGGSAPLSMRMPVSHSPIVPLTRTFPSELLAPRGALLSSGFRVLVAEGIPESDPVGRAARAGWTVMERQLTDPDVPIEFHRRKVRSALDLRAAVDQVAPDVLILCAHGHRSAKANVAGVLLGSEFTLGTDLGEVPPVVLLSACSVTPRGAGEVAIPDLLLRQGAIAVLGAAVPVDVYRNAILFVRLMLHMTLSVKGEEPEADLLSIWHRVQAGNAVNDVITGNEKLNAWALTPHLGMNPPHTAFMTDPELDIRLSDVYADTEAALLRIAESRGERQRLERWLLNPGYLPESAMYVFLGDPESVRFKELSSGRR